MRQNLLSLGYVFLLLACSKSTTPADTGPDDTGPADVSMSDSAPTDTGDAGTGMDTGSGLVCGPDERMSTLVFFGTSEPTFLPLTDGQVLAVVDFGGCSGAFVSDEWVLTATHCGIEVGRRLCVGPNPLSADVCFAADRVENNPAADMTLVHVDAPASTRIPELEPIAIMTERIDDSWIGRTAEAAGYGTQEDDSIGEREFTAQPIASLGGTNVVVDGMGTRGLCFGDSGGPLMVLASDSTVRVLGDLSFGDPSCVGQDSFARTDLQLEWIEAIIGPVVVDGAPCGRLTEAGDCLGTTTAVRCDEASGTLTSETCPGGTTCGWDEERRGFGCVTDDPCEGVSAAGACQGDTAVWCADGELQRQQCGECDQLCRYVSDVRGFYCRPDPCIGIDPEGECDGNVLTSCDTETGVSVEDCTDRGRVCGFSRRRNQNRCIRG